MCVVGRGRALLPLILGIAPNASAADGCSRVSPGVRLSLGFGFVALSGPTLVCTGGSGRAGGRGDLRGAAEAPTAAA